MMDGMMNFLVLKETPPILPKAIEEFEGTISLALQRHLNNFFFKKLGISDF